MPIVVYDVIKFLEKLNPEIEIGEYKNSLDELIKNSCLLSQKDIAKCLKKFIDNLTELKIETSTPATMPRKRKRKKPDVIIGSDTNKMISALEELYPNHIISTFSRNYRIYNTVYTQALANGITTQEYLKEIGFDYQIKHTINRRNFSEYEKVDKEMLEKAFPNHQIDFFGKQNSSVHSRVITHAKAEKLSLKEYLNKLGFEYEKYARTTGNRYNKKSREEYRELDKNKLSLIYPDGIVEGIKKIDRKFYGRLNNHARDGGVTFGEYIKTLGFNLNSENNPKIIKEIKPAITTETIANEDKKLLRSLYPDGLVCKLYLHQSVYRSILRHSKKVDMSINEYISSLGIELESAKEYNMRI